MDNEFSFVKTMVLAGNSLINFLIRPADFSQERHLCASFVFLDRVRRDETIRSEISDRPTHLDYTSIEEDGFQRQLHECLVQLLGPSEELGQVPVHERPGLQRHQRHDGPLLGGCACQHHSAAVVSTPGRLF